MLPYLLHVVLFMTDLDAGEVEVLMMPSEEEIRRAQEECALLGAEVYHADAHLVDEAAAGLDAAAGGKNPCYDCLMAIQQYAP